MVCDRTHLDAWNHFLLEMVPYDICFFQRVCIWRSTKNYTEVRTSTKSTQTYREVRRNMPFSIGLKTTLRTEREWEYCWIKTSARARYTLTRRTFFFFLLFFCCFCSAMMKRERFFLAFGVLLTMLVYLPYSLHTRYRKVIQVNLYNSLCRG